MGNTRFLIDDLGVFLATLLDVDGYLLRRNQHISLDIGAVSPDTPPETFFVTKVSITLGTLKGSQNAV